MLCKDWRKLFVQSVLIRSICLCIFIAWVFPFFMYFESDSDRNFILKTFSSCIWNEPYCSILFVSVNWKTMPFSYVIPVNLLRILCTAFLFLNNSCWRLIAELFFFEVSPLNFSYVFLYIVLLNQFFTTTLYCLHRICAYERQFHYQ